jgi:S1-C subfamily serine protease
MRRIVPLTLALALAAPAASAQSKTQPAPKKRAPAAAHSKKGPGTFRFSFASSRGRLGVNATSMTEELRAFFGAPKDAGILVQRVQPGTPAEKAGVHVGDVITRVDGKPIDDTMDVSSALGTKKSGERVALGVIRGKRYIQLSAKLDTDPSDDSDFGFDFDLGNPMKLFQKFGGNGKGGTQSWFKSWTWQWPPPQGTQSGP